MGKKTMPEDIGFEESLKDKDVKYLEELLSHNNSQIQSQEKSVAQIKNCNTIIKKVLTSKKREAIVRKIETSTQFYQETILPQMTHSPGCRIGKPYDCDEIFRGVMRYRDEEYTVVCPKCALEYIIDNPWCGIDINLTVDFNFDNY